MNQIESISRVLRDIGIFLIGLAAIIFVVHFVFIRKDPQAEMMKVMQENMTRALKESRPLSPSK